MNSIFPQSDMQVIQSIFYSLKCIRAIYNLNRVSKATNGVYCSLDIWKLISNIDSKYDKLHLFISFYKYLPKQGSAEWKIGRGSAIAFGGSEIGGVCGLPKAGNLKAIALSKLGLSTFKGCVATRWGNVFEDVSFGIFSTLFSTTVYETGTIPGLRDDEGQVVQSYSPDGLVILNRERYTEVMRGLCSLGLGVMNVEILETNIILTECKCPISRVPDGKVPPQYAYQPLLGACTIPIVDSCLYIENVFRKCGLANLEWNDAYDVNFHSGVTKGYAMVLGFIGIYKGSPKNPLEHSTVIERLTPHCHYSMDNIAMFCDQIHRNYRNLSKDHILPEELPLICEIIDKVFTQYAGAAKVVAKSVLTLINHYEVEKYSSATIVDYGISSADLSGVLYGIVDGHTHQTYHPEYCYHKNLVNVIESKNGILTKNNVLSSDWVGENNVGEPKNEILRESKNEILSDPQLWYKYNLNKFRKFCYDNSYEVVGLLPWKLFGMKYITMAKDPQFIEKNKDKILDAVAKIKTIKQNANSPEELRNNYNAMFG